MARKELNIMLNKPNTPNPINATEEGVQPTGKLSFRDYMSVGISKNILRDGEYDAVIQAVKFVQDAKDPDKDYLRLEIKLPDRITVENRFISGYFIFEREIKEQLGLADQTIPVPELMQKIVNVPLKIWLQSQVSTKDKRTYQNMHFRKPIETSTPEIPKF